MNKKLPPFQKASNKDINFKSLYENKFHLRFYVLPFFVVIIFLVLLVRLFQLTIVKGNYYHSLAEGNRIREIDIEAPRGTIQDRKGFTMAYSEKKQSGGQKRFYTDPEAFSHLVGYRQLADSEEIKNDLCQSRLKIGDKIGKEGVEKIFECQLRGKRGKKLIEVDAEGKFKKTITLIPPQDGANINLAVDLELQKKAYLAIKDKKGAVIATKPQTGEVIILTSSPSFNPSAFEDENQLATSNYFKDKNKPLFDRALKGTYPPGSVFKPVLAAGALEDKIIDEKFEIEDKGELKAGPLTFGNWFFKKYGKTDGQVNIVKGIKRSNDIFFYTLGAKLGEDKIKKWAQKFGYNASTGIPLGDEEGLIPSPFWKDEKLKEGWFLGDTYNFSIGQGYVLTTPIQVNLATAVFANGGRLCRPHLLKGEEPDCKNLNLSKKTLDLVREGMKEACSTGGTGWPFFDFKVKQTPGVEEEHSDGKTPGVKTLKVGCKTGTAEAQKKDALPHAWFTIFAPWDKPEIVVTVLVENSGEGSEIAAPIAKEILTSYFERSE